MKVDTKEKDTKRKLSPLVGESVSGADERGKGEQKRKNKNKREQNQQKRFCPVYANMPLSPRKARHFPPSSGEANAKEKEI